MPSFHTSRRTSSTPLPVDNWLNCGADAERVARGRELLLPDEAYVEIAETFRALADGTRAKIVYSLLKQELCTCDLAAIVGMSESVVSQHLRVLRQLRLVRSRRSGKMVFHTLDDAHIRILLSVALSHVRDVERTNAGLEGFLSLLPAADLAGDASMVTEAAHGA
jgi:ArsR family transcriptional regulator, lead/cadmium/zinc/bismuth-responsive transcriptional repressor